MKCGKQSCGCANDVRRRHGPYTYLRFEEWDEASQQERYRREYVPQAERSRVRRWISRYQDQAGRSRAVLSLIRSYVRGIEAPTRKYCDSQERSRRAAPSEPYFCFAMI